MILSQMEDIESNEWNADAINARGVGEVKSVNTEEYAINATVQKEQIHHNGTIQYHISRITVQYNIIMNHRGIDHGTIMPLDNGTSAWQRFREIGI